MVRKIFTNAYQRINKEPKTKDLPQKSQAGQLNKHKKSNHNKKSQQSKRVSLNSEENIFERPTTLLDSILSKYFR